MLYFAVDRKLPFCDREYAVNKVTFWIKRLLSSFVRKEREFIMHAAHELRTPMAIIKGYAEILEDLSEMPLEQIKEIAKKNGAKL